MPLNLNATDSAAEIVCVDGYQLNENLRWAYSTYKNLTGSSLPEFLKRQIKLIYPTIMIKWYRMNQKSISEKAIAPNSLSMHFWVR